MLRGERQQLVLERANALQLLLRVGHLDGDAVAQALERFRVSASDDLLLELAVHVADERVQGVQAALDALDELLLRLDSIMQDEQTRALVADAISREIRTLRYLGLSRPVSGWSANKFVDGLSALIAEIAADPEHLIRQRFDEHVGEYIERLEQDPHYALEVERILAQLLEHPATSAYFGNLWQELTAWLESDLARDDSRIGRRIVALCRGLGDGLAADESMRNWINEQLLAATPGLLERYRGQIGAYIAQRVENWESRELVEQLEQSVGKDLQYIRINGTLVGGLVGLVLHALTQLVAG